MMHPSSTHLPDPPYKKIKQSKTQIKTNQNQNKTNKTLTPPSFFTSSFVSVALVVSVYHMVYTFVQSALIANIHYNVSLV